MAKLNAEIILVTTSPIASTRLDSFKNPYYYPEQASKRAPKMDSPAVVPSVWQITWSDLNASLKTRCCDESSVACDDTRWFFDRKKILEA